MRARRGFGSSGGGDGGVRVLWKSIWKAVGVGGGRGVALEEDEGVVSAMSVNSAEVETGVGFGMCGEVVGADVVSVGLVSRARVVSRARE